MSKNSKIDILKKEKILKVVESKKEEIIEFTRELLKIPSVNHPPDGDEKKAQQFIAERLNLLGMEVDIFSLDEVEGVREHPAFSPNGSCGPVRDYSDRPNVIGLLKGKGGGKSLLLNSHIDVVPVGNISEWRYNPWAGKIVNGILYGRGAVDDKGPLSAIIMAIDCIKESQIQLSGDLIFESVIDEEFGGANGSLAALLRGYRADGVIVGEPTNLKIAPWAYGCQRMQIKFKGKGVHPYEKEEGIDAVLLGMKIFQALSKLERKRTEKMKRLLSPLPMAFLCPLCVSSFEAGGGIMADNGIMDIWLATIPQETQETILEEVNTCLKNLPANDDWIKKHPLNVNVCGRYIEPTSLDIKHPLIRCLQKCFDLVIDDKRALTYGGSGDLFIYTNYGKMPGCIFGPGKIQQAHAVDEQIKVEDLLKAIKVYALMIAEWCI